MFLSLKRVLAFSIDYVIIIMYAVCLFLVSTFLSSEFGVDLNFSSPIKSQLLSFVSLTLPVFFYFYLFEKSQSKATLGKRFMKLKVVDSTTSKSNIFLRNFLKLLPWEIAHVGVYQIVFYNNQNSETPIWVWVLLIFPQVIMLMYCISVFLSKGKESLYDKISNTKIKLIKS